MSGVVLEPFESHCVSEHPSCTSVDIGVSVGSAPFGERLRINFYPYNCDPLVYNVLLGLFRQDQPISITPGQIIGVRKD